MQAYISITTYIRIQDSVHKLILTVKNAVVTRSAGTKKTAMRLKIEVKFDRVSYTGVNDGTCPTVPRNMVSLANDNNGDLRIDV
jgi:hypothetical protein